MLTDFLTERVNSSVASLKKSSRVNSSTIFLPAWLYPYMAAVIQPNRLWNFKNNFLSNLATELLTHSVVYLGRGLRGAQLFGQLPPGDGVLRRLLVVQPRVLRLDGRQAVPDGLGEDVGEQLALLRLPALVLELQHCDRRREGR